MLIRLLVVTEENGVKDDSNNSWQIIEFQMVFVVHLEFLSPYCTYRHDTRKDEWEYCIIQKGKRCFVPVTYA